MAETVQQALNERLTTHPDKLAMRYGEQSWTWREHLDTAAREAALLTSLLDPERPPHVGALLGNTPEMLTSMAAAGLNGHVLVGINDTRRGPGLLADVHKAQCQILLVDDEHRELLEGLDTDGLTVLYTDSPEYAEQVAAQSVTAAELSPRATSEPTDTFMLIFTSGTSGDPKPVRVSQFMVVMSGLALGGMFDLTEDDVVYLSMPLFHSNAVFGGWSVGATLGAAMAPADFSASGFLADLRRYGITYLNYVGKPLAYVLATPELPDDADNPLRAAFGNEASERDIDEFARRFGCRVVDAYGSTETAVIITRQDGTPKGSIGKGFPDVAIYNSATVTECPVAQFDEHGALLNPDEAIGELVNKDGAGFFAGYYNDPAANDQRMRHGIYWSGDLAYRDADGWIYLAGRTSDWMRVDGENFAAAPIERILMRLHEISRVAVYAVPDGPAGVGVGDQIMAALVLRDETTLTPEQFEQFLAEQPDLSPKAWPRYVRVSAELPTTATNKILKRALIAQGVTDEGGVLWEREARGRSYHPHG